MAVKASVAATLAWVVASRLPGAVQEYAFYAPFGAVAVTYPAVSRSAIEAVRALAAIMLGAALGVVASHLPGPGVVAVVAAVGIGVLLAGVPWLGDERAYVPIAAIFVLFVGGQDEIFYAASYAGLFVLGAACALGVNALAPSLPAERADRAIGTLRRACTGHLRAFAAALDPTHAVGDPPDRTGLTRALGEARRAVEELEQTARGNRRARRDPAAVARRTDEFRALQRVVGLVDDLHGLSGDAPWGTTFETVPDELRRPLSVALRELAATTAEAASADAGPARRADADEALVRLAEALRAYESEVGPDAVTLVVATVLTTLRRSLSAVTPPDRVRLAPSPFPSHGSGEARPTRERRPPERRPPGDR